MKKIILLLLILFILFLTLQGFTQTAEEITNKVIKAHGGEKNLQSVKNLVISGKAVEEGKNDPMITFRFIIVYPHKFRYDFYIQDTEAVFASDGTTYWNINPMFGVEQPAEMNPNDALEQKHQLDFLIPLLDKDEILRIENRGSIKESDREFLVLNIEYTDGFLADYFIDKESCLITKRRQIHRDDEGGEHELILTLYDYRDVEGIKFPFKMLSSMATLIYTIDTYKINVSNLDDSIFVMPEK
jgi:outer membrane lipoprotein-sorting protein